MLSQRPDVRLRHIYREPPTGDELRRLARGLPGGARELLAPRAARAKELGLDAASLADEELLALLAREPRLLRRPLVLTEDGALAGFDRERFVRLAETGRAVPEEP